MPHHFLYLKNAYHILITKPSLPHLYLYYIQKLVRNSLAISQNYRAALAPYPVMICSGSLKNSTTITSSVLRKM